MVKSYPSSSRSCAIPIAVGPFKTPIRTASEDDPSDAHTLTAPVLPANPAHIHKAIAQIINFLFILLNILSLFKNLKSFTAVQKNNVNKTLSSVFMSRISNLSVFFLIYFHNPFLQPSHRHKDFPGFPAIPRKVQSLLSRNRSVHLHIPDSGNLWRRRL